MKISSLEKGKVLHLPLDKISYDSATHRFTDKSAYSNHGIGHGTQLGGSPTFVADHMGQLLRAAPFNGIDDYVDCGNDSSLDITEAITVSAWVKPIAATAWDSMVAKHSADEGFYLLFDILGQKVIFVVKVGGASKTAYSNAAIPIDSWTHLVGSYDNSRVRIYVNGIEQSDGTDISGNINTTTNNLIIGRNYNSTEYFNGGIADARVYNRALSTDEISLLYNSYRSGVRI